MNYPTVITSRNPNNHVLSVHTSTNLSFGKDYNNDLINGAFFMTQGANPGLLTLRSMNAGGLDACFTVKSNGNVGIFNPYPVYALDIGSSSKIKQVRVNGSIVWGSDQRMKKNISELNNSLRQLKQLRSVSYLFVEDENLTQTSSIPQYILEESGLNIETIEEEIRKVKEKNKKDDNRLHYGFLAQELENVFPDLVYKDDEGYLAVDYIGIIPVLVDAIKEQQHQIE